MAIDMNEHERKEAKKDNNQRLGIDHSISGVDNELIESFAKITRLIGIVAVAVFALWGLFYEWVGYSYSYRSPFQSFIEALGFRRFEAEMIQWILAAAIMACGWFARFSIGNVFVVAAYKIFDFLKGIFRSI